ncbi:MAG: hypothetical protein IVW55_06785 [Chloroflexi bacterium]|nr:hypothetical protein [Chloroflexota bacterium]
MHRSIVLISASLFLLVALAGCEVPTPPPELPTATPGSQNPENLLSRLSLTQVAPAPDRGFTPVAAGPGRIYFARSSGLWRIMPDGSGEMKLTDLPVVSPPAPSPDGAMVAWVSGKGDGQSRELYVMPSGGGTPVKVVSGLLPDNQRLGWTPDSAMLGYVTFDPTTMGAEEGWAIDLKGGKPVTLVTMPGQATPRGAQYESSVQWSPDSKWVAVSGVNNPTYLMRWPLLQSAAGQPQLLPGGEPDWAPDSRSIVYPQTLDGALIQYYVVEGQLTPFVNEQQYVGTGLGEYSQGPGPRWSPASVGSESDLIAYRSRSAQGEPRVSVRTRGNVELAPLPSLTNNPSWAPSGDRLVIEAGYLKMSDPLGPQWTPTGLSIAVLSFTGSHQVKSLVKDGYWPAWGK